MKKFVTMVMVLVMVLVATTGLAEGLTRADLTPVYHMNDLEQMSFGDDVDYSVSFYAEDNEHGYIRVQLDIHFTDEAWNNYNEGTAYLYDGCTGELIDTDEGRFASDIDCSSRDAATVQNNIRKYFEDYPYENDYENYGLRIYSIWF